MTFLGKSGRPLVIGHRGGRGEGWPPENTLAAFERARAGGAQGIETDVRLCATGEVIALHDPTLERVTGGADSRPAAAVTLEELSKVALVPDGKEGASHRVPTLRALLAWAKQHLLVVNVEIKHDVPSRRSLARAVARDLAAFAEVSVLLSSFDPVALALVAIAGNRSPRALLTDPGQRYASLLHALARPPFVTGVHPHRSQLTAELVRRCKARGLRVGVWTVNDADEARTFARMGVDLLITDDAAAIGPAVVPGHDGGRLGRART